MLIEEIDTKETEIISRLNAIILLMIELFFKYVNFYDNYKYPKKDNFFELNKSKFNSRDEFIKYYYKKDEKYMDWLWVKNDWYNLKKSMFVFFIKIRTNSIEKLHLLFLFFCLIISTLSLFQFFDQLFIKNCKLINDTILSIFKLYLPLFSLISYSIFMIFQKVKKENFWMVFWLYLFTLIIFLIFP